MTSFTNDIQLANMLEHYLHVNINILWNIRTNFLHISIIFSAKIKL